MIVEGQIVGGVAHGIGNALFEWMGYDDGAQPITTTFADYLMPGATEVPRIEVKLAEFPSPLNPLGVKGVGESGCVPAAGAIISAVENALAPFGVRIERISDDAGAAVCAARREGLIKAATDPARSPPLGELDGDVLGALQEDELAAVELHHLVAELDAGGGEFRDLRVEVVYGEADVIEAELVELADVGIGDGVGPPVVQELHFGVRVLDASVT